MGKGGPGRPPDAVRARYLELCSLTLEDLISMNEAGHFNSPTDKIALNKLAASFSLPQKVEIVISDQVQNAILETLRVCSKHIPEDRLVEVVTELKAFESDPVMAMRIRDGVYEPVGQIESGQG